MNNYYAPMARKYDASRRTEAAQRTREAILAAAFKLHGLGITDLDRLGEEANVSVATIRKHFPTREELYDGCTSYGMHLITLPDLDLLASTEDPIARTRLAVQQVYHLHDQISGHVWSSYKLQDESPVLDRVIKMMEGTLREIAGIVIEAWRFERDGDEALGFVIGMLSPLTFRALCFQGGLDATRAIATIESTLVHYLSAERRLLTSTAPVS